MRILLIGFLSVFCSCARSPLREADLYGKYMLSYDKMDALILQPDHRFNHTFRLNGQLVSEQGEWNLFEKDGARINFQGETHNFSLGMIGVRESQVVVRAHEILIQGGDGNASWYELER